mmetsp:Transcript_47156/g.92022  ORF Transcript_47156/g.92022 Transcript_47156/m.92022 type:complete len:207 (+) Transcript_47156:568-1188(+)
MSTAVTIAAGFPPSTGTPCRCADGAAVLRAGSRGGRVLRWPLLRCNLVSVPPLGWDPCRDGLRRVFPHRPTSPLPLLRLPDPVLRHHALPEGGAAAQHPEELRRLRHVVLRRTGRRPDRAGTHAAPALAAGRAPRAGGRRARAGTGRAPGGEAGPAVRAADAAVVAPPGCTELFVRHRRDGSVWIRRAVGGEAPENFGTHRRRAPA